MNPGFVLLALFIGVPLVEIYLLIEVGSVIGAPMTLFIIIFTAVFGSLLLRHQGFGALQRARANLEQGVLPAMELMEGVVLLVGAVLLLTPGFATDILGFLTLIPPLRRVLIRHFLARMGPPPPPAGGPDSRVIEGEFHRED